MDSSTPDLFSHANPEKEIALTPVSNPITLKLATFFEINGRHTLVLYGDDRHHRCISQLIFQSTEREAKPTWPSLPCKILQELLLARSLSLSVAWILDVCIEMGF